MNKVLVVDDARELCALIRRAVSQEDMDADCCHSGRTGLEMLKENEYQLVVLDVMMPGFNGFETLERIRKESSVPVLMLTAKDDSISKVRGLRNGADDYLTKPFIMEELLARITSLVRRYTRFNQGEEDARTLFYDGLTIDLDARHDGTRYIRTSTEGIRHSAALREKPRAYFDETADLRRSMGRAVRVRR